MLKSFDIRVQSSHSANWYDGFKVDTVRGIVYFHQCDARRNGQVARYMQVTFHKNGTHTIEARSAKGTRYEQFGTTQCLKIALSLLNEARSEALQLSSVASVHAADNKGYNALDIAVIAAFVAITIVSAVIGIGGIMEGADSVSVAPNFFVSLLSAYLVGSTIAEDITNNKD